MARPAIELKASQIGQIEDMAGKGYTLHQIALMLDVSDSTLDRWLQAPKVKRAYERGRLLALDTIAGSLFAMARDGDVTAAIFYLKSQFGWRDRPKEDEQPTGSQVVFYLPDNGRGASCD